MSEGFAKQTIQEAEKQLAVLPTRDVASLSWRDNGIVYLVESEEEAIRISDDYAPEHLELHVRDRDKYFDRLTNYGSLFIGEETTVAYGDKTIEPAGPPVASQRPPAGLRAIQAAFG